MDFGLRLTYSSDLCFKFGGAERFEERHTLLQQTAWQVIGSFDFLEVTPIARMESVGDPSGGNDDFTEVNEHSGAPEAKKKDEDLGDSDNSDQLGGLGSIGVQCGLILTPFPSDDGSTFEDNSKFIERIVTGTKPTADELLIVVRICLSSVAYEIGTGYQHVQVTQNAARRLLDRLIQSEIHGIDWSSFRSLGSPDIVLIFRPTNADHLLRIGKFIQMAKGTSLQSLVDEMNLPNEQRQSLWSWRKPLNGHAFAAIEPSLSFRVPPDRKFAFEGHEFDPSACNGGLQFEFTFRVDVGHEKTVTDVIKSKCSKVEFWKTPNGSIATAWAANTIGGFVHCLKDVVAIWRNIWFDSQFRAANMIDGATSPRFSLVVDGKDEALNGHDLAWVIRDEVVVELNSIRKTIHNWSKLLPPNQAAEINGVVNSFYICFFNQELVSAARDLLPFFRQLSLACADKRQWKQFLRDADASHRFGEELETLTYFLQRAVRNRLEHRVLQTDPPIPHTLEHGASKFVNAYSVIYWLSGRVFGRGAAVNAEVYSTADDLAVCVCVGIEGRVRCHEVFRSFRIYTEDLENGSPKTRLLILDISGRNLFRPEASFIHCLHETVEMSDWMESIEPFRYSFNCWSARMVRDLLTSALIPAGRNYPERQRLRSAMEEVLPFRRVKGYVRDVVAHAVAALCKSDASTSLSSRMEVSLHGTPPERFLDEVLTQSLSWLFSTGEGELSAESVDIPEFAEPFSTEVEPPSFGDYCRLASKHDYHPRQEAVQRTESLPSILRELIADWGMWCGFRFIKESQGRKVSLNDVNLIFESLVVAQIEWEGVNPSPHKFQSLLQRWCMVACAIDQSRWRDRIREHLLGPMKKYSHHFQSEGANSWFEGMEEEVGQLSASLRKVDIRTLFPDWHNAFNPTEHLLLGAFLKVWETSRDPHNSSRLDSNRLSFVWDLWATSTRLRFPTVFKCG